MKFFLVDTIGEVNDELCILKSLPKGVGLDGTRMQDGRRMGEAYPEDAVLEMSPQEPGLRLESLIGNVQSLLIVSSAFRSVIEEQCGAVEVEYLPFSLLDHKGRVHSTDYSIINPIGTIDCLNLEASEIDYFEEPGDPYDGDVLDVEKFVIRADMADSLPALFRVPQDPSEYFINETMAEEIARGGLRNVLLEEVEVV